MRIVVPGHDKRRYFGMDQVLGRGAGGGIAVEQRVAHLFADANIRLGILGGIGLGEGGIALDDGGPRPAARVGAERLAVALHQIDDGFKPFATHEADMFGKALMARQAIFVTADRPIQDHARNQLRMRDAESRDRPATHAAAHDMRARNSQMIEQPFALGDEMHPGHALDAAAGLAAFAAVEQDAGEFLAADDRAV